VSGRFAALRHRDFTLFWLSNVVSRIGTQMRDVALAQQLYVLTHSPLALGLMGASRFLPIVILALGGGVAADALDRRRIMLATQSILAVTSASMALLTWRGWMTTGMAYGFVALSAAANAFDGPARQTIVPNLLPDEDLPNGLTLSWLGIQVATTVGPALGGLMLDATSFQAIYALDAISYAAVLVALRSIRTRKEAARDQPSTEAPGARARLTLGALVDGLRFLRHKPVLIWLMVLDFGATFFAGSLLLLPIFANEIFAVGPRGLGWLLSAPSAGALIASAWLAFRPPIERYGRAVLGSVLVYGVCIAAFGLTHSYPLALLFLAASGAADTVSTVVRQVVRQTFTPDALRGRMTGVNMIFFIGGPQLGEVEAGAVAELSSVRASVVSGGLLCVLVALSLGAAVPLLRRLKAGQEGIGGHTR
jgi:MFS family permease